MLDGITGVLAGGGEINFTGFGKFSVAERGPRQGVNPRTGERITIAGGRVPKFSAGGRPKAEGKGGGKHHFQTRPPPPSGGGGGPGCLGSPPPPGPAPGAGGVGR